MTTVFLHGILAEEYGDRHEFELTTHADLVRAFTASYPTFKRRILQYEAQGWGYRLIGGACLDGSADIGAEDIGSYVRTSELHLVPVIEGSGTIGKIIGGAVLIGAGFLLGGPAGGLLAKGLIGVGASMALGGISKLLAPKPPAVSTLGQSSSAQTPNTIFGSGNGLSSFTDAVPVVYGLARIERPAIISSSTKAVRYPSGEELRNDTFLSVIAALSEGEIVGLANTSNPLNSVLFGDTPLRGGVSNPTSTANNFGNINFASTNGTAGQPPINLMSNALLEEQAVSVVLEQGSPVTRTLSGDYFNVWIKINITALFQQIDGQLFPDFLVILVEAQTDGGGYVGINSQAIQGKTTQAFAQTLECGLTASISKSWNIRVSITKPGETDLRKQTAAWETMTGLRVKTTNYPNTALIGLEVDAKYLSGNPTVKAVVKGMLISVPHNYNPTARSYSGAFNGTLSGTKQYSNNPAWVLYDMLTNARYGAGLAASQIDVYSFYAAGVYCDELVSDGRGGTEPRFTFNQGIFSRVDGIRLIVEIAGSFSCFCIWSNSKIALVQDRPAEPVWSFTQANVVVDVDGDGFESPPFEYSQVDSSNRFTSAQAEYIDGTTWQQEVEKYEDTALLGVYGYKPKEFQAVGCTSRGQAARACRWEIFSSNYNDELVSFRAGRDMLPVEVGDVIEVLDRYEQGKKLAGRVVAATTSTEIRLDQDIDLEGVDHDLTILYPDGSQETRDVTGAIADTVTILSPFTAEPDYGNLYVLRRGDISPTLWKIISISEVSDETYQVQCSKYLASKWAYIEDGTLLSEPVTSFLRVAPNPPQTLSLTPTLYLDGTGSSLLTKGLVEWTAPTTGILPVSYEVSYRTITEPTFTTVTVSGQSLEFDAEQTTYEIEVRAVSAIGITSSPALLSVNIDFSADLPEDVTSFAINPRSTTTVYLSWDGAIAQDVRIAGSLRLKFSASGAGWDNALLIEEFAGTSKSGQVSLLDGTYYAKWVDFYGNESLNAASVNAGNLNLLSKNIVAAIEEHPDFPGEKINCYVNDDSYLTILPTLLWDDAPGNWDDTTGLFDDLGSQELAPVAYYNFSESLVVSDLQDVEIVANYSAFSTANSTQWDDATGLWDERPGLFNGTVPQGVGMETQIRTSADGITFGDWQPFTVGIFNLLEAEFRAVLRSNGAQNIFVVTLGGAADVKDRVESGSVVTSAIADTIVTFDRPFVVAPPFGVTYSVQNGTTEDEIEVFDLTKDGFKINIKSGGSRISRTTKWITESY